MIYISHLSDIHFGKRFDQATWEAIANAVVDFGPDLIVASGDFVDHPSPAHLLAAKCALRDLSNRVQKKASGRAAEVFVVPGNHDVFESGVSAGQSRLDWFERIFEGNETAKAESILKNNLGCPLGFNEVCQGQTEITSGRVQSWKNAFLGKRQDDFTVDLSRKEKQTNVRAAVSSPILLVLLDSNPIGGGFDAATGVVGNDELVRLRGELEKVNEPYLARVAVVHHHLLPIAFAPGRKITGEPLMVLRNAGAVIRILADHHFDLVLHGHWHKPQFARIDLGVDDGDSYPISVVAAGSAAMRTDDPHGNCANFITIAENGRIVVKSVFYGGPQAPDLRSNSERHARLYHEPIASVKRRAYARARERHVIECDTRTQQCEITENGDLLITHSVGGMSYRGEFSPYQKRPLAVAIPTYGRFLTATPDEASKRAGVTLQHAQDYPDRIEGNEYYWLELPNGGLTRGGPPASYSVELAFANCMKITRWEAWEKAKQVRQVSTSSDWDTDWVGVRIAHPMRRLILSVKVPDSLASCQPHVHCLRHSQYPKYLIDRWGDAVLPRQELRPDTVLQEEENQHLRYEARDQTWCLELDRPMVGFHYELRWELPDDSPHPQIEGDTKDRQRALLDLKERIAAGEATPSDRNAIRQFDLLRETLEAEIGKKDPAERRIIAFFVYDFKKVALRPALSYRSWSVDPLPPDFAVPLGSGIAGAAFLQRRIIPWGKYWAGQSLIRPTPLPHSEGEGEVEMRNVLALPVYHPTLQDVPRPPPWGTIGVVTASSSHYGSPIAGLSETSDEADDRRRHLRALAQTQAMCIWDTLFGA